MGDQGRRAERQPVLKEYREKKKASDDPISRRIEARDLAQEGA